MDYKEAVKQFRGTVEKDYKPKRQRLADIDLFVLDNSIRESTVGALRGHTLQNKHDIFKQVIYILYN